jgi:DNA-binding MarR family transcriptional regulator
VRQVELTGKGRALIVRGFREHAVAMEKAIRVLSKKERLTLQRLLKKLGKDAAGSLPKSGKKPSLACEGQD